MSKVIWQESKVGPSEDRDARVIHQIEPLKDPRWSALVQRHSGASVFHSTEWLEALRRTYGYESIAFTTSAPGERLENGIVFCHIESWLTGRRLVSLPFSDYCDPLVRGTEDMQILLAAVQQESQKKQWRYIEIRPLQPVQRAGLHCRETARYTFHHLDLEPNLDRLFHSLHKDSIQRKVRRAAREGLTYQEGSTESNLEIFYRLLTITRRRHQVPPQPKIWFRNLIACFGENLQIRIALKGQQPVAAMLTLRHKETLYYKYGGSDIRFNNLGGMHLLYWESIQRAKNFGLRVFDLGRSDADQSGLITFKGRWGATESPLSYFRFTSSQNPIHAFDPSVTNWKTRVMKRVFAQAPVSILPALGNVLYKHIG